MTTAIKRRRGTTTQHSTFTGLEGEITIDTTKDTAVVHDGATAGGRPLLREDLANNTEVVTKTGTQTLTNKTLTSPVINTPTGITKSDISLGNVDNTSDATKNAATATLTNKTITLGTNTITGTVAQFQAAVTDGDFATLAGTETLTNKAFNGTLGATTPSTIAGTTITSSALTSGRVTFASTGGLLADSANFVFNGTTLGVGTTSITGLGGGINLGSGSGTTRGILLKRSDTNADTAFWYSDDTNMYLGSNNGFTSFNNAGSERMRISSTGYVGIGTGSPTTRLTVATQSGTTNAIDILGADSTVGNAAHMGMFSDGFYLSSNWYYSGAQLKSVAANGSSGITLGSGSTNATTYIGFNTGTTSDTSPTERLRLNTNGNLALQGATTTANGIGITFPATQGASTDANCLDDYEEGTWTPSLTFGGGSTGLTYTNRSGWYTKVGNMVSVQCNIFLSNIGSSNGTAVVSGLPFAFVNDSFKRNGAYAFADRITPSQLLTVTNSTTFEIVTVSTGTGSSAANLVRTDFANNTYLSYSFTYFV